MDAEQQRGALLRALNDALAGAATPGDVGVAFETIAPALNELLRLDQTTLLACEPNREWVRTIAEFPATEQGKTVRHSRTVGLDVVGSFLQGIEFVPATSGTPAAQEMSESGIEIAWAMPLYHAGTNLGMLSVSRRFNEPFPAEDTAFLRQLSAPMARVLGAHFRKLDARPESARRELVSEICVWPDSDEDPQALFERLLPLVSAAVPTEGLVVLSVETSGEARTRASAGDQRACAAAHLVLQDCLLLGPGHLGLSEVSDADGIRTAVVPLLRGDDTIGLLALARESVYPLSASDLAFLGFFSTVLGQALVSRLREVQLRAAEQRYQHLFNAAPAMYVIVGVQGEVPLILDCNDLFLSTLGYAREEVVGRPLSQFDPSERRNGKRRMRVLANDEERRLVARSGNIIDALLRTTPEFGPDGEIVAVCAMYIDVSERNGLQRQLAHQAFHDALTDLPNRTLFLDRLEQALRRNSEVAVGLLDLDDFKVINDSLGHASGDDLLVAVARRLRDFLMPADTIARMGGDEFTILLEDPGSPDSALDRMNALAQAFEVPFRLGGREVFVDASIGLIVSEDSALGPEELLRRADVAMYEAKRRGKGSVVVFDDSFQDLARHRLDLEADLRLAIDEGQLRVYYQPVMDLATGELAEMEALARWEHPVRGLLPPSEFIPLAEESGLIVALGREVLRMACTDAKRWLTEYDLPPTFRVAVNASVKQLERPRIVEEVLSVLEETGLPPRHLKLEVTESLMLTDGDGAISKLERFAAAGIGIAIDDFGTGYSSLSYLKRLPVDTVKIDRSFVTGIEVEARDTAIVQAVVAFADRIGLTVTVEGVENESQVAAVRGIGANRGQGYYFSRPLPPEDLVAVLKRKRQAA